MPLWAGRGEWLSLLCPDKGELLPALPRAASSLLFAPTPASSWGHSKGTTQDGRGNAACAWHLHSYRGGGFFSECECVMLLSAGQLGTDHGARRLQPAQPEALAELSGAAEGG